MNLVRLKTMRLKNKGGNMESKVAYMIHPVWLRIGQKSGIVDYNVVAIGTYNRLRKIRRERLFKKSKFGCSIALITSCDTMEEAEKCIKRVR